MFCHPQCWVFSSSRVVSYKRNDSPNKLRAELLFIASSEMYSADRDRRGNEAAWFACIIDLLVRQKIMQNNSVCIRVVFPKIVKFNLGEATIISINMQEAKLGGPDWYYHDIWFSMEHAELTEETVLEVKLILSREGISSIRRRYWAQFVQKKIIQGEQLKAEISRSCIAA